GLFRLDLGRQADLANERAVTPLVPIEALRLLLVLFAGLPLQRQELTRDRDLDVVWLHPRKRRLDHDVVVGLVHIEREVAALSAAIAEATEPPWPRFVEQAIHGLTQRSHLREGIPPSNVCHLCASLCLMWKSRTGCCLH